MKKVNLLAFITAIISATSFWACTSDILPLNDAALQLTTEDGAQVTNLSDQVISTADDYAFAFEANGYQKAGAIQKAPALTSVDTVIITVDKTGTTVFPKKMCIDFGTTGFTDKRGNVLKGKIYITISNRMTIAGSTRTFEFANFFVNDNQIKGSKVITYLGLQGSAQSVSSSVGYPSWSIVAKDTVIRADSAKVICNSERLRQRIDNNETPLIYWDDTFSITGSSTGVNAKGKTFTMEIDSLKPLILVGGWRFFVSGVVLTKTDKRTSLLDYGDGTKDAKATITVNGVTKEINLRK